MKNTRHSSTILSKIGTILFLFVLFASQASAHRSPADCLGSGLSINLYSNVTQVKIGDSVKYSAEVFNGLGSVAVVCDATDISVGIVTPDGASHQISVLHTMLSSGNTDEYSDVVTYVARQQDMKTDGTLTSTANVSGTIHQNDTDSQGGGNQGLNVTVLVEAPPVPTPTPVPSISTVPTPSSSPSPTPSSSPTPSNIPAIVASVPTPTPAALPIYPPGGGGTTFWSAPSPTPTPSPTPLSVVVVPVAIVAIAPVPYFPNTGLPPRGQGYSKSGGIFSGLMNTLSNSWKWLLEMI
jgi:hypothetical protein